MAVFRKIRENLRVLARSRPEDKYLLVTGLRECEDVVAVTGDGTNDAPALKKADVGFAMGITGTDVAQHAADIILMDDNFSSIVKACMWGRNIYDNIRRFLQFQLTVNVAALLSAFVGAVVMKESPLKPIQLLWVNLIMNSLASVALASELPTPEMLKRPPAKREDYIVSQKMVKHVLGIALYEVIVIFVIVFAGEYMIPESDKDMAVYGRDFSDDEDALYFECNEAEVEHASSYAQEGMIFPGRLYDWKSKPLYKCYKELLGNSRHFTLVFNSFIYMQVFNMFNARKIYDEKNVFKGIGANKHFWGVWLVIALFQIVITQFTGKLFEVSSDGLTWEQWLISIGLGVLTLPLDLLLKFLPDGIFPDLGKKTHEHIADGWEKRDIDDISIGSGRRGGARRGSRRGSVRGHISSKLGGHLNTSMHSSHGHGYHLH